MPSHALFGDDEIARRRAIRGAGNKGVDALQQANQRAGERSATRSRSCGAAFAGLCAGRLEVLRTEQASLRGQNYSCCATRAGLVPQRRQKGHMARGVDERLRQFEFACRERRWARVPRDPAEKRDFEAALGGIPFAKAFEAATAFGNFVRQYPQSGYVPSALRWATRSTPRATTRKLSPTS